jgi:hypothetical protein
MGKQAVYGFPCVSDPNDFIPDGESCSPAEIEAHRVACANYGKPSYVPNKGCFTEHDADGQLVKHVLRTSWGIGTNLIASCDGCREPDFSNGLIGLMTCHECGGPEFCAECWLEHERAHDEGRI